MSEIVAWTNVLLMVVTALLACAFYCRSATPAALEKRIGERAYERCRRYRMVSAAFMTLHYLQFVAYRFFPLPLPIPRRFPWSWWVSASLALVVAVPALWLLRQGGLYAGRESMRPGSKRRLFGGIYRKIRHPQALSELVLFWPYALLLDSPFLAVFSLLWVPLIYFMCRVEEKDLEIRYGKRYVRYKRSTGMFFPSLKTQSFARSKE